MLGYASSFHATDLVEPLPGCWLIRAKTNAGIWIAYELDSRSLEGRSYFFNGLEMRTDRTVQAFQSTDGRDGHASLDC